MHVPELLQVFARTAPAPKALKATPKLAMHSAFKVYRIFYSPSLGFLMQMIRKMIRKSTAPQTTAMRMTRYRGRRLLWKSRAIQQKTFKWRSPPRSQQQPLRGTDHFPEGNSSQPSCGHTELSLLVPRDVCGSWPGLLHTHLTQRLWP